MKKIILAILLLVVSNAQAGIVTYGNSASWLSDLGGQTIMTEDFDGDDLFEGSFSVGGFLPGLSMEGEIEICIDASNCSVTRAGELIGLVNVGENIDINFGRDIFAFSGLWDLPLNDSSGSFASGFTVRAGSVDLFTLTGGFTGFFGIITDFSFGEISIVSTSGETFSLDDLSFIESTAVPVPAAVWLFGSGLLGLLASSRRKHTAKRYV